MSTTTEIETIVRRVLTRMLASDTSRATEALDSDAVSKSILHLQDSLITLASLPRDLTEIREVHISSRAVVTPSARDAIRNAKGSILRSQVVDAASVGSDAGIRNWKVSILPSNAEKATSTTITSRTQLPTSPSISLSPPIPSLMVAGSAAYLTNLRRTVCPRQALVLPPAYDDAAALREVAIGLRSGHRVAVIIAASPHAIAWQAARDQQLRPVVVRHWSQLAETLAEVPTNLIILATKYWNAPAASNVIRALYKHVTSS